MQAFFTKLRDLSLNVTRLSIMCLERPDDIDQGLMLRFLTDIADIVKNDYNAKISEEESKSKNIIEESMPYPSIFYQTFPNKIPYMVMYITMEFKSMSDKDLFTEDFFTYLK